MKSVPIMVAALALTMAATTLSARTVNGGQDNSNDTSVTGVAGPAASARTAKSKQDRSPAQPSHKVLGKARIDPKPKLQDPN